MHIYSIWNKHRLGFLPSPALAGGHWNKCVLALLRGAQEPVWELQAEACTLTGGSSPLLRPRPHPREAPSFTGGQGIPSWGSQGMGRVLRGGSGAHRAGPRLRGERRRADTCTIVSNFSGPQCYSPRGTPTLALIIFIFFPKSGLQIMGVGASC